MYNLCDKELICCLSVGLLCSIVLLYHTKLLQLMLYRFALQYRIMLYYKITVAQVVINSTVLLYITMQGSCTDTCLLKGGFAIQYRIAI